MLKLLHRAVRGKSQTAEVKKIVHNQDNYINTDYGFFTDSLVSLEPHVKLVLTTSSEMYNQYAETIDILLFDIIDELEDGSIVKLDANSLYIINRPSANSHSLFMTYNCNHYCLMCSEPPRIDNDSYLVEDNLKVIELLDKNLSVIGISGGEPTLAGAGFLKVIRKIREYLPTTYIRVLTNGKSYKNEKFVKELVEIAGDYYISEIPLYHSFYANHDYIVQSKNAFYETVEGIYNCGKNKLFVEIRIVLTLQNYKDLSNLIYFIYKNMPFVGHIALMSLEYIGFAKLNFDKIHINPLEYKDELVEAMELCEKYQLPASIYNLPLCLMHSSVRKYATQSISDWKNEYSEVCNECSEKSNCSGMFSSTQPVYEDLLVSI